MTHKKAIRYIMAHFFFTCLTGDYAHKIIFVKKQH